MIIGCDVDEVCASLIPVWLRRYNERWGDNLVPDDITDWDIRLFVKPECGARIFDILHEPDLYDEVRPIAGALDAIRELRALGHRVVFVTSCVRGGMDHKLEWLIRHRFLPDQKSHADFIACVDKHLVGGLELLIDDRVEHVEQFPGHAILIASPHNESRTTTRTRVSDLSEVPRVVRVSFGHAGVVVDA